jgi:AraC-like DNA-binding protein
MAADPHPHPEIIGAALDHARTLGRLISRETGMSFGRWRQQLSVMLAVKWLADGASIQQVAADLRYESVPSFVTMFR